MVATWHLLLVLLSVASFRVAFATISAVDAAALQSLASQWSNLPASWTKSTDPCDTPWDGIQCTGGRVTELKLGGVGIKGTLSGDVGLLSELVYLDLSSNNGLTGPLPANIGKLLKLTSLVLQGCSFSGVIPNEIGNLRNMSFLALNSNNFSGSIPATIGLLSQLYWLDIADNQLSGPIPISSGSSPGLDLLVKTNHFHFNKNQLSGTINASLFSSKMSLIHLLFDNNAFTGLIPDTIGLVQSLQIIRLDSNKFSGSFPNNMTITSLLELNVANNQLSGKVPNLAPFSALNNVDLSNNSFDSSTAPAWFGSLTSLISLSMENGGLIGQIPPKLFTQPQIQQVLLDSNEFNGTLDMGSGIGPDLTVVNLQNNSIASANISSSYNGSIWLRNNPLCGNPSFSNNLYCTLQMTQKPAYKTSLAQCGLATCPKDQSLNPRNCTCAYPYTGLMICRAPLFTDLSDTQQFKLLESSLWTQLGLAPNSVYLSGISMTADKYLEVNIALFPLTGEYFSVGDVIRFGVLSNQTYDAPPLFGPYYFLQYPYPFPGTANGSKSISIGLIAGIAVGSCVLLIALVLVAFYAFKLKRKAKEAEDRANPFASWGSGGQDDGSAPILKGARFFSFAEIRKYTNNFSESNEIGAGGYGKVYKGNLTGGQIGAIKRAQQGSMQGAQEFKNEIELLSRVHHKNLVTLIGFCYEQGEQMLVYEYISNGTLRDNLVGGIPLDWKKRLEIALGSAKGLAYLHELADPPIIHRDIKSTNILLDENLTAKVADFGLSKLISDTEKGHVSTQVKGTLGYLDPEYYMTQQLSDKSDVYSFGVVLLELVTARLPIEKGKYVVREFKAAIDQYDQEYYGLKEFMDPKILNQARGVGFRKFVQLAMDCVQDGASDRPSMNEVVKEIEIIYQNEGYEKSKSLYSRSSEIENPTDNQDNPYSEKNPMIRDTSSNAFDTSGGYPYQPSIEPK